MKKVIAILTSVVTMFLGLASESPTQLAVKFPERVFFSTEDGGLVYADLYRSGRREVVLAHGGQFNKESWEKTGPRASPRRVSGFGI